MIKDRTFHHLPYPPLPRLLQFHPLFHLSDLQYSHQLWISHLIDCLSCQYLVFDLLFIFLHRHTFSFLLHNLRNFNHLSIIHLPCTLPIGLLLSTHHNPLPLLFFTLFLPLPLNHLCNLLKHSLLLPLYLKHHHLWHHVIHLSQEQFPCNHRSFQLRILLYFLPFYLLWTFQ